ncbi:MAG TPA: FAD-dependent oxidoreductase [Armatimonadota bacterium]|nr:FAD-dependent oxidoreductase [Armatimonadota bacterium]
MVESGGIHLETAAQRRYHSSESSTRIKTGFQRYERPIYDDSIKTSPCRAGCPAGHDIAWALNLVAEGREDLANQSFLEESPFPAITGRVCYHPCESVCNRASYDGAVAINALERAFGDRGASCDVKEAPVRYPETIGVIGSGPAGMTAAYHLTRLGYRCTVYEAQDRPGGVLALGIPPYRLPVDVVAREVSRLEKLGVEFRCGVRIGDDLSFADLRRTHAAVITATGLPQPRPLTIAAPDDPRIMAGLPFLQAVSRNEACGLSGTIVILGGGDVAIDSARSALRLGATSVILFAPEARGAMPAHPEEITAAEQEGIGIRNGCLAVAISAASSGLTIQFSSVDRTNRRTDGSIEFITGSEPLTQVSAAALIYAVGQQASLEFLPPQFASVPRLSTGAWGEMRSSCDTGDRDEAAGVFAAGDVTGTYNVVNAIASGKRAAIGIDTYLRALPTDDLAARIRLGSAGAVSMQNYHAWRRGEPAPAIEKIVPYSEINLDYFPPVSRAVLPHLSRGANGTAFREINLALDNAAAVEEARRCFNCGICNMCGNCFRYCPDSSVIQQADWGFAIDVDHCKGCGICVQECPRGAMSMIPEAAARDLKR